MSNGWIDGWMVGLLVGWLVDYNICHVMLLVECCCCVLVYCDFAHFILAENDEHCACLCVFSGRSTEHNSSSSSNNKNNNTATTVTSHVAMDATASTVFDLNRHFHLKLIRFVFHCLLKT